jgi:hypothetical protein
MATFNENYVGKDATGLLNKAIANTSSIEQGGFTMKENQKGFANIRIIDGNQNLWHNDDGNYTSTGDLDFASKQVTLGFKKLNHTIAKKDFAVNWESQDLAVGATGTIQGQSADAIREECLRIVSRATDAEIWTSLIAEAAADADVIDVPLNVITSANVVAELAKMTQAYSEKSNMLGQDVIFYCNPKVVSMYNTALGTQGDNSSVGFKASDFEGYRFVTSVEIPFASIFLTPKENMFFMVDSTSDLNRFAILDQSLTTGANSVHLVANASYAASYARGSELFYGLQA